jgi:hypothetical protein
MVDDRWVMYVGISDKCAHSVKWGRIANDFLKLAFTGDHRKAKCSCNRCQNRRMLSKYKMYSHIAK